MLAGVVVVGYLADQITKVVALRSLESGEMVSLVGDFLSLRLLFNSGAAFSMGEGMTIVFTVVSVVVVAVVIRVARRLRSRGWAVALGLLLAGALGNLTDRLFREPGFGRGHVVDFIDYNGWFVGNVADIWIVSAAGLIGVLGLKGIGIDGVRESAAAEDERD